MGMNTRIVLMGMNTRNVLMGMNTRIVLMGMNTRIVLMGMNTRILGLSMEQVNVVLIHTLAMDRTNEFGAHVYILAIIG